MSWDVQLDQASFRGVPFECQTIDDEIVRRVVQYKYPYRDGADLEDLGREPRSTRLTCVFMGDNYESDLGAFNMVVDEGKAGFFVHPILGTWNARISRVGIKHSHDMRDVATVDVEVIEDGTSTTLPNLLSVAKLQKEAIDWADQVDTDNLLTQVTEAQSAASKAREFANDIKTTVNDINSTLNQVRRKIDTAVSKLRQLTDIQNYKIVRSLKRLAYSCTKLGVRVQSLRPPLLKKRLAAAMPLPYLAHQLYGDKKRSSEIANLNKGKVPNQFKIKKDTELKVYGR